jgi:hypothetical protein
MTNSVCVVLDSSVLYRDYKLSSASLQGLLRVAALGKATVFLPGVAFDELLHQHAEAYDQTRKQLEETLERFRHMSVVNVPFSFPASKRPYSDLLRRLLEHSGIKLLDYPKITHQKMVQRFYDYRKPLGKHKDKRDKDDAGYKDALIWESALDLLGEGFTRIVLVSGDVEDFGDADTGKLHGELINDLNSHGYEEDAVQYAKSLKEGAKLLRVICSLTSPELIETVATQIRENVNFDELLTTHQREIENAIEGAGEILIGDGADEPSLMWNIEGSQVEIESTEVLEESGEVVVYANARFENEIAYYTFLYDYYNREERFDKLGISLYQEYTDIDRALVGGTMLLMIQFNFIYNPTTHETSEFEIVDIQRTDVAL